MLCGALNPWVDSLANEDSLGEVDRLVAIPGILSAADGVPCVGVGTWGCNIFNDKMFTEHLAMCQVLCLCFSLSSHLIFSKTPLGSHFF